jgi:hypothetical protein
VALTAYMAVNAPSVARPAHTVRAALDASR